MVIDTATPAQLIEVRCRAPHPDFAGTCKRLLMRIDPSTVGQWEIKCPQCRRLQIITIGGDYGR